MREIFCLIAESGEENDGEDETQYVTDFPRLYDELAAEYAQFLPPIRKNVLECIDINYASEFLRKLHEGGRK
jgi:hypothetical protein